MILVSAVAAGSVQSCSNHDWGTDDHTHLAMTIMVTTTVHPKTRLRGKDNMLCRIRYRYKEASPLEERAYGDRTGYLPQHGVIEYLQRLRRPDAPAGQARLRQPVRVNEAACIMGATIHTAAADTMSKHRRGAPRKPGASGRMSEQKSKGNALEQASRNPTARNHCTAPRGQQVWDRINSMRPTGARPGNARKGGSGRENHASPHKWSEGGVRACCHSARSA